MHCVQNQNTKISKQTERTPQRTTDLLQVLFHSTSDRLTTLCLSWAEQPQLLPFEGDPGSQGIANPWLLHFEVKVGQVKKMDLRTL